MLAASAVAPLIPPALILLMCVIAGVATVLLLPSKRQVRIRQAGGAVLALVFLGFMALVFRAVAGPDAATYYFWPFAIIALVSGVRVVTHPRPVYSALYFVLTTFATAGLFVLLWAEFMAAALILIYAGAILVTYVFVIMLAQQATTPEKSATATNEYDTVAREPIVASAVGFALMAMLLFVVTDRSAAIAKVNETNVGPNGSVVTNLIETGESTKAIGRHLFEYHLVNLELAGLLLTVATVGAIVIARRRVITDQSPKSAPIMTTPYTPIDDNPHSIPVYGTDNPAQKAYPEN